ncbi:MAG: FliM/FliN family flagellar motor switch protein [Planctomycetes bacterium]|nr:FliM/FliN family flagellar motor switch protein [Planctomycetota bacterium]
MQDFVSLHAVQDAQDQGDPRACACRSDCRGEYGPGTIRVCLGGPRLLEPANGASRGKEQAPPDAAGAYPDLEVQLTAELASVELPLKDVLAIEPGDVIPSMSRWTVRSPCTSRMRLRQRALGRTLWPHRTAHHGIRGSGGAQPETPPRSRATSRQNIEKAIDEATAAVAVQTGKLSKIEGDKPAGEARGMDGPRAACQGQRVRRSAERR